MDYRYIATTPRGIVQRGTLAADTATDVAQQLRQRNLSILSIAPATGGFSLTNTSGLGGRVGALDKVIFARHLAIMLRAGLSLVESLDTIQGQNASQTMQRVVAELIRDVSNGKSLGDAMSRYPRVFTSIMVGMIRIGEASGTLEENLEYIASELEKDYELKRKVKSALLYPGIVLSATVVLGIGLSIFILPKLVQLFDTFRIALPPTTVVFLSIATFLVDYGWYVLAGAAVCIIGLRVALVAPPVRRVMHRLYLRMPVVQRLIRNANIARLTRIVSILLKSGITINESLGITAQAIENTVYRDLLMSAQVGVQKGQTLSSIFATSQYIPDMATRMIGVGERTGKLDSSLGYLASFYEEEVDAATKNLSTVLEPTLLIIIGLVLGFLAVAIISPIYQFTGSLQQ
ncbi:MAG: type II secretion system F family protein [Candidatus Kerfeldbacteria bacterium]|nr:type II secretion system F family protein [Candidatus Kerfeldbacteria bacterium]